MAAFFYLRSSESNDFGDLFLCPDVKYMIFRQEDIIFLTGRHVFYKKYMIFLIVGVAN